MPHLSIHPATHDEQHQVYRNVHEFWGGGLPLDEFLARRARSVVHSRAQCWVLTVDGRVVSSMAWHPLSFGWRGQIMPGMGVGSVFTVSDQRGQGRADALLREVARAARAAGNRLALLFSDIKPAYYQKLGYRLLPAVSYRCDRLGALIDAGEHASLRRVEPATCLDRLIDILRAAHAADELFIDRDQEYWQYAFRRSPLDAFFLIEPRPGAAAGYVRLTPRFGGDCLIELALAADDPQLEQAAYSAAAGVAAQAGAPALAGWLRASPVVERWFTPRQRDGAIPMVAPLDDSGARPAGSAQPRCHFWHGDHF
jgi:GNAT superfamily N-acetyltransferase